jgi:hypothetical protein
MSLADVQQIALSLSDMERAHLASVLLASVPPESLEQGNDEFERREQDFDKDQASEISREELVKRVNAERRR